MAGSSVALVEQERVDAVEAVKASREFGDSRFDDQVVVGRHQTERVNGPVEAVHAVREELEEESAVGVVAVDRAAVDSESRYVKHAVRQVAAKLPRHVERS